MNDDKTFEIIFSIKKIAFHLDGAVFRKTTFRRYGIGLFRFKVMSKFLGA